MEETEISIWPSIRSYFTPKFLFVLLNIVIGTIVLTSKGTRRRPEIHRTISRSSSVLERLRSIGLHRFGSGDFPLDSSPLPHESELPLDYAPPPLESDFPLSSTPPPPETDETLPTGSDPDETRARYTEHHFGRNKSESHPMAEKVGRMKKSASERYAVSYVEEEGIVRRPVTARGVARAVEEEEVDARADDFINRFRQQLKLQRLDSILRYKEMLNGGK